MMLIFISTLVFRISNPKSIPGQAWIKKFKDVPTLVFWISNSNSIFGQIWAEKFKVFRFSWKFADAVSWGRWFLFEDANFHSDISFLKFQISKFKSKKSNCRLCLEADTQSISKMWLKGYDGRFGIKGKKWIIILSACCSYIFIVARSKNWNNQWKNVG